MFFLSLLIRSNEVLERGKEIYLATTAFLQDFLDQNSDKHFQYDEKYETDLKLLRKKYNFASKNAGAFILESNPGAERVSALLDDSSET